MNKRGVSLIEMMIAMVMLVIIVTTFGRYMAQFQSGTTKATAITVAAAVAKERLELVRADPRYFTLTTLYGSGSGADTTGFPGYSSMRRVTTTSRDQTGSPARDRTTITVRVTWPGMKDTVRLTTVRARP
jgi:prepilin-type N-terminal cleavage/methylation domain-containing protein